MSGLIDGIFGGGKADTSAMDAQAASLAKEEAANKAEADRLSQANAKKMDAIRRRRMGDLSLISTSPSGVRNEPLG